MSLAVPSRVVFLDFIARVSLSWEVLFPLDNITKIVQRKETSQEVALQSI